MQSQNTYVYNNNEDIKKELLHIVMKNAQNLLTKNQSQYTSIQRTKIMDHLPRQYKPLLKKTSYDSVWHK